MFGDLVAELDARLCRAGHPGSSLVEEANLAPGAGNEKAGRWQSGEPADPSEIVELFDHCLGRIALARGILAEPSDGVFRLYPPVDQVRRPLSPRAESAFRTLKEWCTVLEAYYPTHLAPLAPDGAAVLLGRLVAEGVVDEILSTNWDAYVELGCALAGVRVCDGDEYHRARPAWLEGLANYLWVYETPSEAGLRARAQGGVLLLKLHGGVRTLCGILDRLDLGEMSWLEAEAEIRRSFRVSTEDLVHWQESARWVAEASGDGLRSHNVLALGLSGSDPVIYRAFRERLREWERERNGTFQRTRERSPLLVGVSPKPKLRLLNMLTVDRRRGGWGVTEGFGAPHPQVVRAGGKAVLRGAYAGWLLRLMSSALVAGPASVRCRQVRDLLLATWRSEVDRLESGEAAGVPGAGRQFPLIDLLCRSLGPSARFPAVAEGRRPFDRASPLSGPARRWWYSPWGRDADGETLREMAAFAAVIACWSREEAEIVVNPWTGVIFVPANHPLGAALPGNHGALNLLPLAWPWRGVQRIRAGKLSDELRDRFVWGPGRSFDHLARAPLHLIPLPAGISPPPSRLFMVAGVCATVLPLNSVSAPSPRPWQDLAGSIP